MSNLLGIFFAVLVSLVVLLVTYTGISVIGNYFLFGEDTPFYSLRRKRVLKGAVFISFDTYYNMKQIAPDQWEDGEYDYVIYYAQRRFNGKRLYMKTLGDVLKLRQYRKNKEDQEGRDRSTEEMENLVKLWKRDLENFEKENLWKKK